MNAPVDIECSAPTRIDLAGGTYDIWPLYLFHDGAQTINAAISLRASCRLTSCIRKPRSADGGSIGAGEGEEGT